MATDALTPAAEETRLALIEAAESGRITDLKEVADLNELKPDTGAAPGEDLIIYWRRISADGHGRDLMSVIETLLAGPPLVTRAGRDAENARVFVWPAFAARPLGTLTPAEASHLDKLAGPDEALRMRTEGQYDGWQIGIGADGVWHRFRRGRD